MLLQSSVSAQPEKSDPNSIIIVAADGSGNYKTIQGAINSLTDSSAVSRTLFIKKGIYAEKLYIEKAHIIFEGEDREKTIIVASIARDEWRCGHFSKTVSWKAGLIFIVPGDGPGQRTVISLPIPVRLLSGMMVPGWKIQKQYC
ncbi:MAG: hypothetical protein IPO53_12325 [Chitinophagaceae bacterium]|nr:hypothetical protein [Chitinophagaceae bacterium]